jgi:hypothetical protein
MGSLAKEPQILSNQSVEFFVEASSRTFKRATSASKAATRSSSFTIAMTPISSSFYLIIAS